MDDCVTLQDLVLHRILAKTRKPYYIRDGGPITEDIYLTRQSSCQPNFDQSKTTLQGYIERALAYFKDKPGTGPLPHGSLQEALQSFNHLRQLGKIHLRLTDVLLLFYVYDASAQYIFERPITEEDVRFLRHHASRHRAT